ncbi:hypothetical protein [Thiohalospira sp.]|uniref:hypothetical protein n=1 Tax=Thiohalospira sp. TaxID=3080549 RepID=UPI00397F19EF
MRVIHEDKETLKLSLSPEKAQHLLMGLREDADSLGETARQLAEALEAAGVEPPAELDAEHFEHVGPNE